MVSLISKTFAVIFRNLRLYGGLFLMMVVMMLVVTGVPSNETVVMTTVTSIVMWLVAVFLTRHIMAGKAVKLRDAMYNAMTPFLSTLVVMVVAVAQTLPVMILVIAYASAVETNLFGNLGWGIGFLLFAVAMVAITAYLLPATVMAMVAVSAPGLYPMVAMQTASELMRGKRVAFWARTVVLILIVAAIAFIVLSPILILFWVNPPMMLASAFFSSATTLIFQALMAIIVCFAIIFVAVYYYIYYRQLLDEKMEVKNDKKRSRRKN